MAVFVNEPFTAANGTDVDSLTGWDEHPLRTAGQFLIQANRAYASVANPLVYNTGTPASADYDVTATIRVVSLATGIRVSVLGRMDTTVETYYQLQYRMSDTSWRLNRVVDGSALLIGSYVQTLTAGNDYVVKLEMIGTVVNVYIDGTLRIAVDDTAAPITAKGKVGIATGEPHSTTTGFHFDALTATDAAAPATTATYVGVGAAAMTLTDATLNPALPGGVATDDLMVLVGYQQSGSGGFVTPTGWTQNAAFSQNASKTRVWTKFYVVGDAAPALDITTNSTGGIAQVAVFRGIDKTTALDATSTVSGSGVVTTDIGPITGLTPSVAGAVILVVGTRKKDWTSVATLSGDSLTWAEIAEPDSTTNPLLGLVWDYAIFPAAPTAVTSKTFTVTTSSGTSAWTGFMLAFRPATTVAGPSSGGTKVKIAGAFATKVVKRRAAGVFATKPAKPMSDHPPPPPPTGGGVTYTLPMVSVTNQAMPLTFTAAPPTYFVFPPNTTNQAQALSYLIHPPPAGELGMEVLMWVGLDNVLNASATNLATIRSYGIDGFHLAMPRLPGEGGSTTIFNNNITAAKNFADTHPEFRCTIGLTTANYLNCWTPHNRWFDDAGWAATTIPGYQALAQAVADSALVGINIDGEDYPCHTGNLSARGWGNHGVPPAAFAYSEGSTSYTEAETRAKVKARAKALADAVVAITGPVEIYEYFLYLQDSLKELVVTQANAKPFDNFVAIDWIDGWTSNSSVKFYHLDAIYYKPGGTDGLAGWDEAYALDKACYDASPKLRKPNSFHCPFVWITEGPKARQQKAAGLPVTSYDRQWPTDQIILQLQKARQFTEGGKFAIYDQNYFNPPSAYAPVASALQAASA